MLGVPFEDRGPRADDALRALRAALSGRVVSYEGPYHSFRDMVVDPHAAQARVSDVDRWAQRACTAPGRDPRRRRAPAPQAFRVPVPS